MKYVVEFGVRGGAHTDNFVVNNRKIAEKLAVNLVNVFTNDPMHCTERDWYLRKGCPRLIWKSPTHFVAISKLDSVTRGPASAALWRKPTVEELLTNTVYEWHDGQVV